MQAAPAPLRCPRQQMLLLHLLARRLRPIQVPAITGSNIGVELDERERRKDVHFQEESSRITKLPKRGGGHLQRVYSNAKIERRYRGRMPASPPKRVHPRGEFE